MTALDNNNNNISDQEASGAPYFDLNHSGNVTAVLGKTALLNCRVKNIGNKTVRIIRYITILTNGIQSIFGQGKDCTGCPTFGLDTLYSERIMPKGLGQGLEEKASVT